MRRKERKPPFSPEEILSVMDPLLDALAYAHQYTIHRDVKPENIMVTGEFPEVRIKVLDFGIAKTLSASRFTHTAQALGTAYYMAPEQLRGKEIDHRADLFSVGMIIYEMLMGEVAVGIPELPSSVYPELPVEMDKIVGRLLKGNPDDRYADAQTVKKALAGAVVIYETGVEERLKEEEKKKAARQAEIERAEARKQEEKRKKRPKGKGKLVGILVGLCLLCLMGVLVYQHRDQLHLGKTDSGAPVSPVQVQKGRIPSNQQPPTAPEAPAPLTGKLIVKVEPKGAAVSVLNIANPYSNGMELEAGQYHIEVSHAGYETVEKWVSVTAGEENTFSFKLSPIPKIGTIAIQTQPAGAKWYLDGNYKGTTPDECGDVSEGTHQIRVVLLGYRNGRTGCR